jgi:hypothetical protein
LGWVLLSSCDSWVAGLCWLVLPCGPSAAAAVCAWVLIIQQSGLVKYLYPGSGERRSDPKGFESVQKL